MMKIKEHPVLIYWTISLSRLAELASKARNKLILTFETLLDDIGKE